ncbi:MAG: DUF6702 family protein [Planctomycetota bacterium]
MNRRQMLTASLPLLVLSTHVNSPAATAHPFHATSLELEWNPETGCFEAALQLPGPPLDEELARFAERPIALDTSDAAKRKQNEKVLEDWVRSRLKLTARDLPNCQIRWVGTETELRSVWAYFEIRLLPKPSAQTPSGKDKTDPLPPQRSTEHTPCPTEELNLHCRFFEHLQGQVNAATFRIPGRRGSVILTEVRQSGTVKWVPVANP